MVTFHAGCESCPAVETISHIILRCKEAQLVWRHLNLEQLATSSSGILEFAKAAAGNTPLWNIAFACCAVTLWDTRNAKIFEGSIFGWTDIARQISETLKLWSNREIGRAHV